MIPNHPSWSPFTGYSKLDAGPQNISLDSIPTPRSVSPGPEILSQSGGVVNTRNYVAYFSNGNLYVCGENSTGDAWGTPVLLGAISEIPNTLSLAFDQLGRPQIFYEFSSQIKLFGYDPQTQSVTSRFICNGTTPVAAMDYPRDTSRASCDVLLAYVINNQIKFRQQRDKYLTEYPVMDTSPGDNLKLIEIGFRKDRRFGLIYTYQQKSSGGGGGEVDPPENHEPYVIGTWKFNDSRNEPNWANSELNPKTAGIVWDNGEAQASMILGLNVFDNVVGPTSINGNTWSAIIPNDPDYGPYVWIGIGFGQYANNTDPAKGFADFYDVFFEISCNGKLVKLKIQFDPEDTYGGYGLFLCDNTTNVPASTSMKPAVFGPWRQFQDQSFDQYVPGGYTTERYSLNLWLEELCNSWFPDDFSEFVGLKQIGTFDVTIRAIHKTGTKPDIVGSMKFITTGAP